MYACCEANTNTHTHMRDACTTHHGGLYRAFIISPFANQFVHCTEPHTCTGSSNRHLLGSTVVYTRQTDINSYFTILFVCDNNKRVYVCVCVWWLCCACVCVNGAYLHLVNDATTYPFHMKWSDPCASIHSYERYMRAYKFTAMCHARVCACMYVVRVCMYVYMHWMQCIHNNRGCAIARERIWESAPIPSLRTYIVRTFYISLYNIIFSTASSPRTYHKLYMYAVWWCTQRFSCGTFDNSISARSMLSNTENDIFVLIHKIHRRLFLVLFIVFSGGSDAERVVCTVHGWYCCCSSLVNAVRNVRLACATMTWAKKCIVHVERHNRLMCGWLRCAISGCLFVWWMAVATS